MTALAPPPTTDVVIFGGTGDLAIRKLLPALFLRMQAGQLPSSTRIISASRSGLGDAGYRDKIRGTLPSHVVSTPGEDVDRFVAMLHHLSLDADSEMGWDQLSNRLADRPGAVRIFYLAVGPEWFGAICDSLDRFQLVTSDSRIVLEKPLGRDLASARRINNAVTRVFREHQIFRIDHYLGKEAVQNLLATRFANSIFEPLWNARSIDHVEITVAETLGVEERGSYYDRAGAIRDMVQNHLLQLLCLVAMEPPAVVAGEPVRNEKLKVLQALKPLDQSTLDVSCVRGQYVSGAPGQELAAYTDDLGLASGELSDTETFVALKVEIANWRWAGVPFYLRTGKRMRERRSEIVIVFKPVPHQMFPHSEGNPGPNRLVFRLQPDESVQLQLIAKEPGPGGIRLQQVALDLNFGRAFGKPSPDAYERLLMDVVRGNPTLFMRGDEIEAAWSWIEPLLHHTSAPQPYAAGSDGPAAADALIAADGRSWHEEPLS